MTPTYTNGFESGFQSGLIWASLGLEPTKVTSTICHLLTTRFTGGCLVADALMQAVREVDFKKDIFEKVHTSHETRGIAMNHGLSKQTYVCKKALG